MPDWQFEKSAWATGADAVVGIDEAGRGPWAGPVVAGAVVLDPEIIPKDLLSRLDDSKKLKPRAREELFGALEGVARIGVGEADVAEIDHLNILQATMLAMARAVSDLGEPSPDFALVDGNRAPTLTCAAQTVVKGDSRSLSIAAASIVAKVTRDRIMVALDERYPGYGWEHNAGYGTREHQNALARLGVTPEHRRSFAPIRNILSPD